jgi:hypothetical protein
MTAAIRPARWGEFLRQEYLAGFIREGGAAIKFCVPTNEAARAPIYQLLKSMAEELGYKIVEIDGGATKIHMLEQWFSCAADQIDWAGLAQRVVNRLCEREGYQLPHHSDRPFYEAVAERNEISPDVVRMDLRRALDKEVLKRPELAKDFRVAMMHLCLAQLSGGEERAITTRAITDWLTGRTPTIAALNPYLIFNRVTRANARPLFESMLRWVRIAGFPGTLVLLDLARLAVARNPHDGKPYYTASNLLDTFEVLREFIDSTDRLEHCLIAVVPHVSFLDDTSGRGIAMYQALKLRISDDIRARELINPMAALVRISDDAPEALQQ